MLRRSSWPLVRDITVASVRSARTGGLIAARLGAYYDQAGGSPQEIREWFMPEGPTGMETLVKRAVARGELGAMPPSRIVALPSDLVRHELFMTMTAVTPETLVEIVDEIFLPLATNFGSITRSST